MPRRSQAVRLTVLAALAVAATGCGADDDDDEARCVDRATLTVVDDDECDRDPRVYGFYYGGIGYVLGGRASGGSFNPADVDRDGLGKKKKAGSKSSGSKSGGG